MSNVWQYGLSDDVFLDNEAECEGEQSSESNLLSSDSSASTITLSVFLAIVLVHFALLLIAVGITMVQEEIQRSINSG